jgi:hypothetical protein
VDEINLLSKSSCYTKYVYSRVLKSYRQLVMGLNFLLEIEVPFFLIHYFFSPTQNSQKVNTTISGMCQLRYSEGLVSLREVLVYQNFLGTFKKLQKPKTKEEIHWVKEKQQIGLFSFSLFSHFLNFLQYTFVIYSFFNLLSFFLIFHH